MKKQSCMQVSDAFTFLEVLLALSLFTSFMILTLRQESLFVSLFLRSAARIERLYELKREIAGFFVPGVRPLMKKKKLDSPQPKMTVYFEQLSIQEKSSLHSFKDDIALLKITGIWNENISIADELSLFTFIFIPTKEER